MIIRRIIRTGGGGRSGNETAGGRKTVEKIKKKNNYCFLLLPGYLYLSLVRERKERKQLSSWLALSCPPYSPTYHGPTTVCVCVCIYVILNNNNIMYARARPISV